MCSLIDLSDLQGSGSDDAAGDASNSDAPTHADAAQDGQSDASSSAYRAAVLADGPVSYWRLGEASGVVAADETGANDGLYATGVGYGAPGAIANDPNTAVTCLTSTAVSVATSSLDFPGTAPITIELWMNPSTIDNSYRYLLYKETMTPRNGYGVFVTANGGPPSISFERLAGSAKIDDIGIPLTGSGFQYVVFTFDGTTVTSYLNAVATQSQMFSNSLPATSVALTLGGGLSSAGFEGVIDEVAIYSKALTAMQVANHFMIGKGL